MKKGGFVVELLSPVYVAGDRVQFLIRPEKKKRSFKARVKLPRGWHAVESKKLKGGGKLYSGWVPKDAKQGKYPILVGITRKGTKIPIELSVELVRQIR